MNRYNYISKPGVVREKIWVGLNLQLNKRGLEYNKKVSKMTPEEQEKNGLPMKIQLGVRKETALPVMWGVYNSTGHYNMDLSEFEVKNYYEPV